MLLNVPRELLYKRIDDRIDEMLKEGLLEEVQKLKDMGYHRGMVSMQGLGYKEILAYLDGEVSVRGSGQDPEKRYQTFCKTPADLVSQGEGYHLDE